MKIRKVESEPFEILLIPMIDCMLVLIIFFLVATTMKMRRTEVPVELPVAAGAVRVESAPEVLVIGIDREGQVLLAGNGAGAMEPVDPETLHQRLRDYAREGAARRVRIDGDRNARYEDVLRIADLCQFEGLTNVGFHTRAERR